MAADVIRAEVGFNAELEVPPGYISPYPSEGIEPVVSMSLNRPPVLRMIYQTYPEVIDSDYESNTLILGASYYKHGPYDYAYTRRAVDARNFSEYRVKVGIRRRQNDFKTQSLQKRQLEKGGTGLVNLRIPIKSKTVESLFGEGGAGIKVSGYHRINFSGRSTWTDKVSTATNRQSKFPSLNMEQESRFDISGTIGTKITVSVSHDSKTDIPLANRIMLRYKGDEDDIIKSIEAGNTTLSLPNTQFVGYSSRINGLFGIKTTAQIGALELTAIASQEKGTTERTSISAGASASKSNIRDYLFAQGRIYDLGRLQNLRGISYDTYDFLPGDSIMYIEVYRAINSYGDEDIGSRAAYLNLDPLNNPNDSGTVSVVPVDCEYYIQPREHWILFEQANCGSPAEIGVYMIVKRAGGTVDTIGSVTSDSDTPLRLKTIREKSPKEGSPTWEYMWRNVYYLMQTDIDVDGLEINIYKGNAGTESSGDNQDNQDGIRYINILGLDQLDQSGNIKSDGLVDVKTSLIDATRGLLIFPHRKPFASDTSWTTDTDTLTVKVPEIYGSGSDTKSPSQNSAYYIEVSNKSRSSEIRLGKANIIEGSERITLNGAELQKGVDYNINYDFGQVTFLSEEALDPNANLNIDFEYAPFISAEKKTLFGMRAEYSFSNDLKVGSTFLYKSDKATARKPKVGQETAKTIVWDADISYKTKTNFLTTMANALPLFSTEVPSNLAFSAEFAQSIPNPNVDGVAYIDDFEGARDAYSLGVFRENWDFSSRPDILGDTNRRARLVWFNPYDQVLTTEIWNRDEPTTSRSHVLTLEYDPTIKDYRIPDVNEDTTVHVSEFPESSWAGIIRTLSTGAADQEETQFLEVRLKGDQGVLHFEFGEITQDVDGNGILTTEDTPGASGKNDWNLSPEEDLGLDRLPDEQETNDLGPYDPVTNPDPHGDNWYYNGVGDECNGCNEYDYSHINGLEGNFLDPGTFGEPDSENDNKQSSFYVANNYYSYSVDLASERFYVDSSYLNGWRSYRIPLHDEEALDHTIGTPSWQSISYVRIWLESPNRQPFTVQIAALEMIQSNWEDTVFYSDSSSSTTTFNVAVINNQENSSIYSPPPGVEGYYDQATQTREPEQSLLLHFDSLTYGDVCLAERVLYESSNFMGYGSLKMFVNTPTSTLPDNAVVYSFRMGQDKNNYYAYQDTLHPGNLANKWLLNEVNINFNDISALKEYMLQDLVLHPDNPKDTVSGNYRVYGNPSLTQIKYLAMSVTNVDSTVKPTGDIWFDELQLGNVRKDVGVAFRASASGNVADLFNYSVAYSHKNPYFRGISTSTRGGSQDNLGSGKSSTSYNYSISMNLDRFMPKSLGAKIPVSLRYSRSLDVPQLRYNTDIVLPDELRYDERTESISKGLTVSEAFNKNTKNPLYTVLLNKLKTSFSYNRSEGRSPASPMSLGESYNLKGQYGLNFPKVPHLRPFFWTKPVPMLKRLDPAKFYLFPGTWSFDGTFNRNFRISENTKNIKTSTLQRDFQGRMAITYRISDNLSANYNMNTKRDLYDPDLIKFSFNPKKFKFGRETSYTQDLNLTYSPNLYQFLSHKFSYGFSYRENLNVKDSTFDVGASKTYGVSGNLDLQKFFSPGKKKGGSSSGGTGGGHRAKDVTDEGGGEPFLSRMVGPLADILGRLTGWINPIGYDYNERYNYTYVGQVGRASWAYRLGLTDNTGAEIRNNVSSIGKSNAINKNTAYSLRSGTDLFGGLKLDVSYSRKISEDIKSSTNPSKNISTTFPDIRFTIKPMRTFKLFNSLIKKFQPRTAYTRSTSQNFNLTTGEKTQETITTGQRPLLAFSFNLITGMQINFSTDHSVTETKSPTMGKTRTISNTMRVSTSYSFSAPTGFKFPIFGRLKFKSTMSIAVDVSKQNDKTEKASTGFPYDVTSDRSNLTITPTISYSFSSQIKGGLSGRWQDTNDKKVAGGKTYTRELRIYVDIRF